MIIFIAAGVIIAVIFIQRFIYIKFSFENLSFDCNFSETEAEEGDIFYITEEIENKKYLPLPALSTVFSAGDKIAFADSEGNLIKSKSVFAFLTAGMYKKTMRSWRIKAIRRGRHSIKRMTLNSKDIFGLVSVAKDFSCDTSVLVLPSAYSKDEIALPDFTGGSQPVPAGYFSDPFSIIKISPYTYSEPLNKINWKASAKTGELMVNYEQPSVSGKVLVVLDASDVSLILEKNIKLCATLSRMIPGDSEVTFISNAVLPENYLNPLIDFIDSNNGFIKTREFILSSHDRNFRRILAEITDASKYDAEKLLEWQASREFYGKIILVKGGKIIDAGEYEY
jgi:uncharacterized protein (DUF58 family)